MKIREVTNNQGTRTALVTIPQTIMKHMSWSKGDNVVCMADKETGKVYFVKINEG